MDWCKANNKDSSLEFKANFFGQFELYYKVVASGVCSEILRVEPGAVPRFADSDVVPGVEKKPQDIWKLGANSRLR